MGFGGWFGLWGLVLLCPLQGFTPSLAFAFQREIHPPRKKKVGWKVREWQGWEDGKRAGKDVGEHGWAEGGAEGHLPGGSALRPEWGWVLCGVGRSVIHHFGPKQDAGLDGNLTLSHRRAGAAEGNSPQPPPAPINLTCFRDLQASLKNMEFSSKGSRVMPRAPPLL